MLLHGAEMPSPDSLPESLRDFAFRNAFEPSHTRWESDVVEMTDADNRVRIHNGAAGPNMCLDVVNDGSNSKLTLARCGEFNGQSWSVTAAGQAARFFQLRNDFTGRGRCLAAVEQPDETPEIRMDKCAATPAQRWRLTPR